MAGAFKDLELEGTKCKYFFEMISGKFVNMNAEQIGQAFGETVGNPFSLIIWMTVIMIGLDTFVAICSGLIIFSACAAFNVDAGAGAGLVFVSIVQIHYIFHFCPNNNSRTCYKL